MGTVDRATHEEKLKAFDFFYHHDRSLAQTAKYINRDRKTVTRWSEDGCWAARANKIDADIATGADREIVKETLSNVKLAQRCLNKEVEAYLLEGNKAHGRLRDIVLLFNYIDKANGPNEIAEAIREAAKQDDVEYDPALADEIILILRKARQEERRGTSASPAP